MKIILLIIQLIQVYPIFNQQVWLRISQITHQIKETEQLSHDVCLVDDYWIKIKFDKSLFLTIQGNNQTIQRISLQELGNKWIQILFLIQQGSIQIEHQVIQITDIKLINITCKENHKKYYDNWFIEVYMENHHNNFILLEKVSFYKIYDQYIQDNYVLINIWMKQIAFIYRPEYIFIDNQENKQDSIIFKSFQNNIDLIVNDIQLLTSQFNMANWYQILIEFNQNQCLYQIQSNEKQYKHLDDCNQSYIVSKQLFISTIGSYFHLQIQYDQSQYQCSPGCQMCSQYVCLECFENQNLISGQCQCHKMKQQNRSGICAMYPDLFESNYKMDQDYLQMACPYGYTQGENKCIECPKWKGEYCFECLIQKQLQNILLCEYLLFGLNIYWKYQLIDEDYQIISDQSLINKFDQFYEQSNLLFIRQTKKWTRFHINRQQSKLVNHKELRTSEGNQYQQNQTQNCPFNCDKCQMYNNDVYCLSLIDNQNYTLIKGISIFNETYFNTYQIKISIFKSNDAYQFLHNDGYYSNIKTILDMINYQSIIISGINIIEVEIYLIGYLDFNYIIDQIEQLISYQRLLTSLNKFYLINLYQTLSIFSDGFPYIINGSQIEFPIVDKLILSNFLLQCNNSIFRIQSQIVILKNTIVTSINESQIQTKINFLFQVTKLIIENINIVSLILDNTIIFDIILLNDLYNPILNIKNIQIYNCTMNLVKLFNFTQINTSNITVNINYLSVYNASLNKSTIIQLNDLNLNLVDVLIFDNLFDTSQFIHTLCENSFVSLQYAYFNQNIIMKVKFIEFQQIYLNQISFISCIIIDSSLLFKKQTQNYNQKIEITNFLMEDSKILKSYLAYLEKASYVKIQNIKIQNTQNQNSYILINVQSFEIFLEKITLFNYQGQFIFSKSDQITIKYMLFQNVTSDQTLLQFSTTRFFDLQYMYINNLTCQLLNLYNNFGLINIEKVNINNIKISSNLSYIFQIISTYETQIELRYFHIFENIIDINYNTDFHWLSIIGLKSCVLIESMNLSHCKLKFFSGSLLFLNSLQISIIKILIQHLDLKFLVEKQLQQFFQVKSKIVDIKSGIFHHILGNNVIFIQISNQINSLDLRNLKFYKLTIVGIIINFSLTQANQILLNNVQFENIFITQPIIKIQISQSYSKSIFYNSIFKNITTYAHIIQIDQPEDSYLIFRSIMFGQIKDVNDINYIFNLNIWNVQIQQVFVIDTKIGFLIIKCNHLFVFDSQFNQIIFGKVLFSVDQYNGLILNRNYFLNIELQLSLIGVYNTDIINYKFMESNQNIFANIVGESILCVFYTDQIIIRNSQFINNRCEEFCISLAPQQCKVNKIQIINNKFVSNKAQNYLIQFYKYEFNKYETSVQILINRCIFIVSNNLLILQVLQEQNQIQVINSDLYGLDNQNLANYKLINCNIIRDDYFEIKQVQYDMLLNINNQVMNDFISFTLIKNNSIQSNISNEHLYIYLPSGQILNKYQILLLNSLSFYLYVDQFIVQSDIVNKNENCSLEVRSSQGKTEQNFTFQIGEEISNRIQFTIDPYSIQSNFLHLICQSNNYEQVYQIKAFPCQMGEYYIEQQCKLCDIIQYQNSVQKHQNKCLQFNKEQVKEMKQGLLKLHIGFWRPNLFNQYIEQCDKNCLGGWQAGDKSCQQGYLGALCHECDIYNIRGDGQFSKIEDRCLLCDQGYSRLISSFVVILLYQILQIVLTNRNCNQYIEQNKQLRLLNRHYFILRKLEVDQISISFRILQDVYFKLIFINKLQLEIPSYIKIGLNIFPYQIINQGLYCKISQIGPNILLLELTIVACVAFFILSLSLSFILILYYLKYLKYSISYVSTTILHGYKQSFRQISYLLISQLLYTSFSGDQYLVGNLFYKYSEYIKVSIRLIPIATIYFILPLLIIIIIKKERKQSEIKFNKIWAYMIKDYSKKFKFWELNKLINYSLLIFVYFTFLQNINLKIVVCATILIFEQQIQNIDCPYTLKNLNILNRKSQQTLIIMLLLFYIQANSSQKIQYPIIIVILLLNCQLIISHSSNILRVIKNKYVNHYQNILIQKFPNIKLSKSILIKQNSSRAKSNFKKIISIQRTQQFSKNIFSQMYTSCNSPLNQEIELVEIK